MITPEQNARIARWSATMTTLSELRRQLRKDAQRFAERPRPPSIHIGAAEMLCLLNALDRAEEALGFYCDPTAWVADAVSPVCAVIKDRGKQARDLLDKMRSES